MKNSLNSLLFIIENPMTKKPYKDHVEHLRKIGKIEQASLFEYLMNEKFKNKNNNNEQSRDD